VSPLYDLQEKISLTLSSTDWRPPGTQKCFISASFVGLAASLAFKWAKTLRERKDSNIGGLSGRMPRWGLCTDRFHLHIESQYLTLNLLTILYWNLWAGDPTSHGSALIATAHSRRQISILDITTKLTAYSVWAGSTQPPSCASKVYACTEVLNAWFPPTPSSTLSPSIPTQYLALD